MAAKKRGKRRSARTEEARWLKAAVRQLNGVIVTAASEALSVKIKDGKAGGKPAEPEFADRRQAAPEHSILVCDVMISLCRFKAQ